MLFSNGLSWNQTVWGAFDNHTKINLRLSMEIRGYYGLFMLFMIPLPKRPFKMSSRHYHSPKYILIAAWGEYNCRVDEQEHWVLHKYT